MITLLAALVLAQAWPGEPPADPPIRPRVFRSDGADRTSRLGADDYAFFEFAPPSGAGMGAPCACTTPTGAKGEALTFTRASRGMCTKGNTTTGIVTGDLVNCLINQPRVMPGGDGSGPKGLLVEAARTNVTIRSQELNNAAWTYRGGAQAWPNDGGAPDGTQTAEAIHLDPTTTPSGVSGIYSAAPACTAGASVATAYVKGATPLDGGVAQSGTIQLSMEIAGGVTCASCTYNPTTWTRCSTSGTAGGSLTIQIGNESRTAVCASATNQAAKDIYVWGVQCEASTYASSYIPTTTVAATRATEVATINSSGWASSNTISEAATVVPNWTSSTVGTPGIVTMNGANGSSLYIGTTLRFLTGATANPSSTLTATTPVRVYGYDDGTNAVNAYDTNTNSVATGAAANRFGTLTGIGDGSPAGVSKLDGVVKQVCISPVASRCR